MNTPNADALRKMQAWAGRNLTAEQLRSLAGEIHLARVVDNVEKLEIAAAERQEEADVLAAVESMEAEYDGTVEAARAGVAAMQNMLAHAGTTPGSMETVLVKTLDDIVTALEQL